jgi:hypothetical protein
MRFVFTTKKAPKEMEQALLWKNWEIFLEKKIEGR